MLQIGRVTGLIGFVIVLIGAYWSFMHNTNNLYGRLRLMTTVTGSYNGYAANS